MKTIRICCGTGCLANGSAKVAEEFERLTAGDGNIFVECDIKRTGCNGFCENGPLVTILPDEISYYHVKVSDVKDILEKTVLHGELVVITYPLEIRAEIQVVVVVVGLGLKCDIIQIL